jgi:hypothetical protein
MVCFFISVMFIVWIGVGVALWDFTDRSERVKIIHYSLTWLCGSVYGRNPRCRTVWRYGK